jgi:glycosyltransferase involved in cell wall biosynthesis
MPERSLQGHSEARSKASTAEDGLRIVHLSSVDGVASYRLHTGLRRLGIDSTMFLARRRRDDPSLVVFQPSRSFIGRARRRLRGRRIARDFARYRQARVFELFSDDRSPQGGEPLAQLPPCDLFHVHTLLGLVDYQAFFATIPRRTPVVRTLHDINFFSGGCHQDAWCGKFAERCGACPQLGSRDERDLSRKIWERKRTALHTVHPSRLHIAATSRWIAGEARRSPMLQPFPIAVIPNGVDTEVFRPRDRAIARSILGLPPDVPVVLFVADPITRINKGFAQVAEALDGLDHPADVLLLSVGRGRPPVTVRKPHRHLGYISDERLLSVVYNAADLFVVPSMQDNCPQTALEAIACGTPVIGYATCGIPEIVRAGLTGLLVPPQDVAALRTGMRELLLDPPQRARLAVSCREVAVREYALEVQAQRFAAFYRAILGVPDRSPVSDPIASRCPA